MTLLSTEVVAALATMSDLEVQEQDLSALAEVLAHQARLVQPLLELSITGVGSPPPFDPRWTADVEPRTANSQYP